MRRLDQPIAVEINRAGMMPAAVVPKPVPVNEFRVGIEAAEESVRQDHLPGVTRDLLPTLDRFRASEDNLLAGRGLIDDALRVGLPAAGRADALAINALVDSNDIAGLSTQRGGGNALERLGLRAIASVVSLHRNVVFLAEQGECGCQCESNYK